jgi:hypothetical protein
MLDLSEVGSQQLKEVVSFVFVSDLVNCAHHCEFSVVGTYALESTPSALGLDLPNICVG